MASEWKLLSKYCMKNLTILNAGLPVKFDNAEIVFSESLTEYFF